MSKTPFSIIRDAADALDRSALVAIATQCEHGAKVATDAARSHYAFTRDLGAFKDALPGIHALESLGAAARLMLELKRA